METNLSDNTSLLISVVYNPRFCDPGRVTFWFGNKNVMTELKIGIHLLGLEKNNSMGNLFSFLCCSILPLLLYFSKNNFTNKHAPFCDNKRLHHS